MLGKTKAFNLVKAGSSDAADVATIARHFAVTIKDVPPSESGFEVEFRDSSPDYFGSGLRFGDGASASGASAASTGPCPWHAGVVYMVVRAVAARRAGLGMEGARVGSGFIIVAAVFGVCWHRSKMCSVVARGMLLVGCRLRRRSWRCGWR